MSSESRWEGRKKFLLRGFNGNREEALWWFTIRELKVFFHSFEKDGTKFLSCFPSKNWGTTTNSSFCFPPQNPQHVGEEDFHFSMKNKAGESNRFSLIQRLRIGVWQMELLAKKHYPPLANDLPVNDQEFGVEGRTDCVDNATNTTTFLKVLLELGYLQGWQIIEPKVRKPWDINRVHWTAAVRDSSNKTWSVDSWFRRHGHLPFVMPLSNWQREELAWEGPHQQLNPYPKNVADLCP